MNRNTRFQLSGASLAFAVSLIAAPSFAQSAPPVAPAPSTSEGQASAPAEPQAPATADANASSEEPFGSNEIIVTAQKRAESIQDVPTAISAVSGETLARQNITNVADLQTRIATVNMGEGFGFAKITMRGLGASSNFANEDPAVVLYSDGAVISRPEVQSLSFFDLERIEILRGPQGTLYGRNSTGGTINLITAKPTDVLTGYARIGFGRFNAARSEFALGGPLTDTISARVAGQIEQRDGFGINEVTGNDIDSKRTQAGRIHLLWEPVDAINLLLTGEYAHSNDSSGGHKFFREYFPNSNNPGLASPGRGGFPVGERNLAADYDPSARRETWSTTATFDWRLGDAFTLRNIANYREVSRRVIQDYDASSIRNAPRTTVAVVTTDSEQFSNELQLLYDGELAGRPIEGIVGAYYFTEDLSAANVVGARPVNLPNDPPRLDLRGIGSTRAAAAFWHLKYGFLDRFAVRAGGRYNDEKRTILNSALARTQGGVGPQAPLDLSRINGSKTFKDYTHEFGLDFEPTPNILFYYTYAEGFKSGAGLLAQTDTGIIDPETVKNHEVGVKSRLFDRRLTFNLSAFSAKVKGLQRQRSVPNSGLTGITTLFLNVGELTSKGVEVDAVLDVTDNFRLTGSLAYLDAKFSDFLTVNPLDATLTPLNVRGNRPDRSPEWKFNVGADYNLELASGASVVFSSTVAYTGNQFFTEFNDVPVFQEGDYALLDANITYTSPDKSWTGQVWGKNLTDQTRKTEINTNSVGRVIQGGLTPPLTWGATVGYRF